MYIKLASHHAPKTFLFFLFSISIYLPSEEAPCIFLVSSGMNGEREKGDIRENCSRREKGE